MPVIVVANPKGGVGKTALATDLAGCFTSRGHAVMLGNVDRQQPPRLWLGWRPSFGAQARAEGRGRRRRHAQPLRVPLLAFLRNTQNYVHLAACGLTLWDVSSARFERDPEQWRPIQTWVN